MFEVQRMEKWESNNNKEYPCWVTVKEFEWRYETEIEYNRLCKNNPSENYRLVEVREERMVWE